MAQADDKQIVDAQWDDEHPEHHAQGVNGRREGMQANRALRDYLLLGAGRSLEALLGAYARQPGAPTHALASLRTWAALFAWDERAACFDRLRAAPIQAAAPAVPEPDPAPALTHPGERIRRLEGMLNEMDDLLRLARRLAAGCENQPSSAALMLRSAAPLYTQARGMLADLARESDLLLRPAAGLAEPGADLSALSDAELESFEGLLKKVQPRQLPLL